jgi:hypothetical protein
MNVRILSTTLLAAAFSFCLVTPSWADISSTIGVFDEPANFSGPFPTAIANLGNFTFSLPAGFVVAGATISGTFGNNDVPGLTNVTADSDYYVDGNAIEVAACDSPDPSGLGLSLPCDSGSVSGAPTPWSYTFTGAQLTTLSSAFAAGSLDFNVIQNYYGAVETGPITLDIVPTPEPAPISFVLLGLPAIALLRLLRLRRI